MTSHHVAERTIAKSTGRLGILITEEARKLAEERHFTAQCEQAYLYQISTRRRKETK